MSTYLRGERHAIKLPSRWNLNNFPCSVLRPPSAPDIRPAARRRRSIFPHLQVSRTVSERISPKWIPLLRRERLLHLFNIARGNVIIRRRARTRHGHDTAGYHRVRCRGCWWIAGCILGLIIIYKENLLFGGLNSTFSADKCSVIYFSNDIGNAAKMFLRVQMNNASRHSARQSEAPHRQIYSSMF